MLGWWYLVTPLAPVLAVTLYDLSSSGTTTVTFGNCVSNKPTIAPAPPDYVLDVTLTASSAIVAVGQPVTIAWHYSISTAPQPIPLANSAQAIATILLDGAVTSSITAGPSEKFPPTTIATGEQFQIPDFEATFVPEEVGVYTFTPGDNEQDVSILNIKVGCTASGATPVATITVVEARETSAPADQSTSEDSPKDTSFADSTPKGTAEVIHTKPVTGEVGHTKPVTAEVVHTSNYVGTARNTEDVAHTNVVTAQNTENVAGFAGLTTVSMIVAAASLQLAH